MFVLAVLICVAATCTRDNASYASARTAAVRESTLLGSFIAQDHPPRAGKFVVETK